VVSRRDLILWLREAFPVILIVYDGRNDRGYWLHVQDYFSRYAHADLFLAGQTINVHIPLINRFNRRSVRRIVQYKNAIRSPHQWEGFPDV
jgi:hypothetical protein